MVPYLGTGIIWDDEAPLLLLLLALLYFDRRKKDQRHCLPAVPYFIRGSVAKEGIGKVMTTVE